MSVAVAIKVNDGIAIAADSAGTLATTDNVLNIYNNANKVVNLYKGKPIGMMFWDTMSIGRASLSTLAKDLRKLLTEGPEEWKIEPSNYTMAEIADKVHRFFYTDRYLKVYADAIERGDTDLPSIGMYVGGYSANGEEAEEFTMHISRDGQCELPHAMPANEQGWNLQAFAMAEPIVRLVLGISQDAFQALVDGGVPQDALHGAMTGALGRLHAGFVASAMPIQDALDLAHYLVHTAVMYYRFAPGHQLVGGPIELAAITKHEGFRWVTRKYFYDRALNPE